MDVRQQRSIRLAEQRLKRAQTALDKAKAEAGVQESVDNVLTALNHYRRFRICIQWCLIIGLIPFWLLLGIISPLGPGFHVLMTEFEYWPVLIAWIVCWFLLAWLFDRSK